MAPSSGLFTAVLAAMFLPAVRAADEVPSPPREFRAAWIATVSNIDWPSQKGLSTQQQKHELQSLLDKAVELHLNAVILQIRPSADALYDSKIEPWSEYLAGTMGQAPKPYYDPLAFAVEEAHRRGLQLHVWFNPYRVRHQDTKTPAAPNHASRAMKDVVRAYGKYLWFDPGEPAARKRFIDVLTDVVKRYDIDGVHIDDYFYPYPERDDSGKLIPFPDDTSYAAAKARGEKLDRDAWRRQNCNRLVEQMYKTVKQHKPWVLVGISPFGIWRPGFPEGITGLDQYDALYADARKWLNEGWVDYFTPQLYWPIEGPQSYPKLLAWWHGENARQRHLWPGNAAHRVRQSADSEGGWPAEELLQQIELTRKELPKGPGNVFFSMKSVRDNRDGLADKLKAGPYKDQALVPDSPWLGEKQPGLPKAIATRRPNGVTIRVNPGKGEKPYLWVIRTKTGNHWNTRIVPAVETSPLLKSKDGVAPTEAAVSAVTRLGREGPMTHVNIE